MLSESMYNSILTFQDLRESFEKTWKNYDAVM